MVLLFLKIQPGKDMKFYLEPGLLNLVLILCARIVCMSLSRFEKVTSSFFFLGRKVINQVSTFKAQEIEPSSDFPLDKLVWKEGSNRPDFGN